MSGKQSATGQIIRARLASGVGQGKYFTRLDWARRQFIGKLGIDPFPGTINLIVDDAESRSVWVRLTGMPGVRIENPNGGPNDCDARCFHVAIEGQVDAAIVLPEVTGYPPNQIEIIAPICVRDALGIDDGDWLSLENR